MLTPVVQGACEAILDELHGAGSDALCAPVQAFVLTEWERMRIPFGWGVAGLAGAMGLFAFVWYGRGFRSLPLDTRKQILSTWSASSLYPFRTFVQWIRALTALAYFETEEGLRHHQYDVSQVRAMTALYNSTSYDA